MEIIADILGVVSEGAKKTRIMYQANLSYKLLVHYLGEVMEMGLVATENGNLYELTAKGAAFLEKFQGYHARRVEVEEQLNTVQEEKVMLENRFLNARNTDPSKKEAKKAAA